MSVHAVQVVYHAVIRMQIKALCAAAIKHSATTGLATLIRPVIPITGSNEKLSDIVEFVTATIEQHLPTTSPESVSQVDVKVGATIMLPRTCFIAQSVCHNKLSFFNFDTDSLSELVFGLPPSKCCADRRSENKRRAMVMEKNIYEALDESAVQPMIRDATKKIKSGNSTTKLMAYGSQLSNSSTVKFFDNLGFDAVACASVNKISVAKLASAQANISKHHAATMLGSAYDTHWPSSAIFGV